MPLLRWIRRGTSLALAIFACMSTAPHRAASQSQALAPAVDATVPRITASSLAQRMTAGGRLIIFDVRDQEEFRVSRLQGALRVDQNADTEQFIARVKRRASQATIVFYCTTSPRSDDFAQSVYHDLKALGAREVFVLSGGIIAWHNENRALVDAKGATPYVHAFNDDIKKQLLRPELARF